MTCVIGWLAAGRSRLPHQRPRALPVVFERRFIHSPGSAFAIAAIVFEDTHHDLPPLQIGGLYHKVIHEISLKTCKRYPFRLRHPAAIIFHHVEPTTCARHASRIPGSRKLIHVATHQISVANMHCIFSFKRSKPVARPKKQPSKTRSLKNKSRTC